MTVDRRRGQQADRRQTIQATATAKRSHGHEIRIAAIVVAVLGILAAGAVFTATRTDTTADITRESSLLDAKTNANVRFAEMNTLPELSVARPQADASFRFAEINELPEAPVAQPPSYERARFLDINVLPETPVSPPAYEAMRFAEINALPDSDTSLVAPASDRLGQRH